MLSTAAEIDPLVWHFKQRQGEGERIPLCGVILPCIAYFAAGWHSELALNMQRCKLSAARLQLFAK